MCGNDTLEFHLRRRHEIAATAAALGAGKRAHDTAPLIGLSMSSARLRSNSIRIVICRAAAWIVGFRLRCPRLSAQVTPASRSSRPSASWRKSIGEAPMMMNGPVSDIRRLREAAVPANLEAARSIKAQPHVGKPSPGDSANAAIGGAQRDLDAGERLGLPIMFHRPRDFAGLSCQHQHGSVHREGGGAVAQQLVTTPAISVLSDDALDLF